MVIAAAMPGPDVEKVSGITTSYSAYLTESGLSIPPTTRMERVGYVYINLWSLYYIEEGEYVAKDFLHLALAKYVNAAVNPPMTQGNAHGEVAQGRSVLEVLFEYVPWRGAAGFSINVIDVITRYALNNYWEAVGIESIMWEPPNQPMLTMPAVIA